MGYFPELEDKWHKLAQMIDEAEGIYITTHINPDGDAVGSEMALARFISARGKKVRIINHSATPDAYRFLDPESIIETCPEKPPFINVPGEKDVVIFVDLGNYNRSGNCYPFIVDNPAFKVIIDHHPPEDIEAELKIVSTKAAATGSLIYDFITTFGNMNVDYAISEALLTAIATDTGYFRYSNTTDITHSIAAALYKKGARVTLIRRNLETGYPLSRQRLLGLTLKTLRLNPSGEIAYAFITEEMFHQAKAKREDTDGIIDHIRVIKGIKIAALIIQEGKKVYKVSFRSTGSASVSNLANKLGGGGHPKAAGATVRGSLKEVIHIVLEKAESLMSQPGTSDTDEIID